MLKTLIDYETHSKKKGDESHRDAFFPEFIFFSLLMTFLAYKRDHDTIRRDDRKRLTMMENERIDHVIGDTFVRIGVINSVRPPCGFYRTARCNSHVTDIAANHENLNSFITCNGAQDKLVILA